MRGEHVVDSVVGQKIIGSSPHARGAPAVDTTVKTLDGIIPACAGSTQRRRQDHEPP